VEEVARLLARGQAARRVGETAMNKESSRSHSVFTCALERSSSDARGLTSTLRSRLNLVDLAGALACMPRTRSPAPSSSKGITAPIPSCEGCVIAHSVHVTLEGQQSAPFGYAAGGVSAAARKEAALCMPPGATAGWCCLKGIAGGQ
jgi:hypothetical protein